MNNNEKALRNLSLLNILTFGFGFRTFEGVAAIYFTAITGSFAVGMSIFAIMNISASLFEIPTGILSDRIGRKKTIIMYYFSGVCAITLFFFAESTPLLILSALFSGLSIALQSGTYSAFVYENLEVLQDTNLFKKIEGKRQALRRYAMVIGGMIGTAIIFFYSIKTAIGFTLIIFIATFFCSFFLQDISKPVKKDGNVYKDIFVAWSYFIHSVKLRNISIGRIISGGLGNVEYRFRSLLYAMVMPEWLVNLLGLINNLLSGIFMQTTHIIVKKVGIVKSLVGMDIFDRLVTVPLIIINTTTSGFIMTFISSAGFGVREVSAEDLLQAHYSKEQRATMGSLVGFFKNILYGIAAITLGIIADKTNIIFAMLLLQPLLLTASFFFYRGVKK